MAPIDYNLLTRLQNSVGTYNVLSYGATADGVTDDTAAIKATLAAAKVSGVGYNTIFFPPGTYKFTQPLVFPNGANVFGDVHAGVPSRLRYYGADGTTAITLGEDLQSWSGCQFANIRLDSGTTRTVGGRGLVIINPTNNSHVHDILVQGFPDGQIHLSTSLGGAGNPGPNFFKLSNFFVTGGITPLEVTGGREQTVIEYGGIDLTSTSQQGFLQTGGEGACQLTLMTGVKIEGAFDVPGFKHAGAGVTQFIGCTRYNNVTGTPLTSAGPAFLFDYPALQDCHMQLLGCTTLGVTVGVAAPGRGVSMTNNPGGSYIPWFSIGGGGGSGGISSMFAPTNNTYKYVALHNQMELAWTTAGDPMTVDTNLYRSAPNVLKTDDTFQAALGVATMTKAGTPTDADWAVAPPIGTMVFDTTGNKIWIRTAAATWKGVVVA